MTYSTDKLRKWVFLFIGWCEYVHVDSALITFLSPLACAMCMTHRVHSLVHKQHLFLLDDYKNQTVYGSLNVQDFCPWRVEGEGTGSQSKSNNVKYGIMANIVIFIQPLLLMRGSLM